MKKRILSIVLTLCLVMTFVPFAVQNVKAETGKKITDYAVGDTLEFGYYPQSRVTDKTTITALNALVNVDTANAETIKDSTSVANGWTSYGYYSGLGSFCDGQMLESDYMRYTDVIYGNEKYRGVVFDAYRPEYTGYKNTDSTYQDNNGYEVATVYWFKYEPVKWRVLDPTAGLILSETVIDSQPFNNYMLLSGSDEYGQEAYWGKNGAYANDYEGSSIRKWLNDDFYSTAFSIGQQNDIKATELDNFAFDSSKSAYDSESTSDKIFLLSWKDVLNENYGFTSTRSYTETRTAQGSDYAKIQGLNVYAGGDNDGNSYWRVRSAGSSSSATCGIDFGGHTFATNFYNASITNIGVRPALALDTETEIAQCDVKTIGKVAAGSCDTGDTLEFGYYPQSKVEDENIVSALNTKAGVDTSNIASSTAEWTSYNYYSSADPNADIIGGDNLAIGDWMRYTDVVYGDNKYRGVVFDKYRPNSTIMATEVENSYQVENGYSVGTVYWFKFEPVTWRVLDPATGLVISETVIDSQAYNDYVYVYETEAYGDKNHTYSDADGNEKEWFANNYEKSSIRKWLNDDFLNTAFSASQQKSIATTNLDNHAYNESFSKFDSASTDDKIYLLSFDDVQNEKYGFSSDVEEKDEARKATGSDYAKCQGLFFTKSSKYYNCSSWLLRSAGDTSYNSCAVKYSGKINEYCETFGTCYGVRPAMKFNTSAEIVQYPVTNVGYYQSGDTLEYGWYPQSKVTDESVISSLNALAKVDNTSEETIAASTSVENGWVSYGYYSGTGNVFDGEMTAGDWMRYIDIVYDDGNKYRGVVFDSYRPFYTGLDNNATYQFNNGYYTSTVYWFKYEPITWKVLDPTKGMVMSETVLDSQAYNNYLLRSVSDDYAITVYWGNSAKEYYANDYEKSDIRKWLNDDFYNTAFSASQKNMIATTELNNSAYDTSCSEYNSETTKDKIYLLSYADALKESYGFISSTDISDTRIVQGSDYAKGQGLYAETGYPYWYLRSAGGNSCDTCGVEYDGYVNYSSGTCVAGFGVRPALNLNLMSEISQSDVSEIGFANYTVETYTMNSLGEYQKSEKTFVGKINKTVTADNTAPVGFEFNAENSVLSGKVASDGSLVLKVYFDRNTYNAVFNANGGAWADGKTEITVPTLYGAQIIAPENPTRSGYVFDTWSSFVGNLDNVNGIVFTAVWKNVEAPVITGLEAGKTYCVGKTFTVSDSGGVASVTANGKVLTPDASGNYVLDSANGEVTVVATDLDGNAQTVTVTVNDHNFCLGKCTECGKEESDTCFLVKFFRYIVDWFTALIKSIVAWIK